MSARNYIQAIGAGETITLPGGRYFYVRSALNPITIEAAGNTRAPVRFENISAGSRFGPVAEGEGWRFLKVTSASAQNVEIVQSDDGLFEIAAAVTVTGTTSTSEQPSSSVSAPAPLVIANGAAASIAANLARRRISLGASSGNAGSVYVQPPGAGAGRGSELAPGIEKTYPTTAALDVRNDSGAPATVSIYEET